MIKSTAIAASALIFCFWVQADVNAAQYPDKPITVISTFAAGGGGDTFVRYFANRLQVVSGNTVIVVNRPGANGLIATKSAIEAKPDGYSVLIAQSTVVIGNTVVMRDANYDPRVALQPVAPLVDFGMALLVNKSFFDGMNVQDFVDFLRKQKEPAFVGVTSPNMLFCVELFKALTGAPVTIVNYKGIPELLADLGTGQLQFAFIDTSNAVPQAKKGFVNLLAVTHAQRNPTMPDVPTMKESGIANFEFSTFSGAWVPTNTPDDIVAKLEQWFLQITRNDDTKTWVRGLNGDVVPGGSDLLAKMTEVDFQKWKAMADTAKIVKQ